MNRGECFVLAAEGTRQPVPGVGAKFKSGPFIFALSGQFAIVPIVLRGAAECLPKGRLLACTGQWRYDLTMTILPPVPTVGLTEEDRPRLQEDIKAQMTKAYNKS